MQDEITSVAGREQLLKNTNYDHLLKGIEIMKTTIDKCNKCGALFEDEAKYTEHVEMHAILMILEGAFPKVVDDHCAFANGGWTVQRDKDWLDRYIDRINIAVGDIGAPPQSYGWYRCLGDGGSMLYGPACRILNICPKCYREWGQAYYANNCNHKDKVRRRIIERDVG